MKVNFFCQMRLLFSQWKTFIIRQTVAITGSIDYTDLEIIASKKIQYHHLGSRLVPKHDFSKTRLFARLHNLAFQRKTLCGEGVNRRTEANSHFCEIEQHENHLLEAPLISATRVLSKVERALGCTC